MLELKTIIVHLNTTKTNYNATYISKHKSIHEGVMVLAFSIHQRNNSLDLYTLACLQAYISPRTNQIYRQIHQSHFIAMHTMYSTSYQIKRFYESDCFVVLSLPLNKIQLAELNLNQASYKIRDL